MRIADVAAIALVWPEAGREYRTSLRPIGHVGTIRPEIVAGRNTLSDRPGWGIELDERTLERRGSWA